MNEVTPSWFSDLILAVLMGIALIGLLFRHRKGKGHNAS